MANNITINGDTGALTLTGTIAASNYSGTSSGTNTGDQTTVSGNAGTATALQNARTINGTSFNGTANVTVTADASTLTNTTLNSTVLNSSLTSAGVLSTIPGSSGTAVLKSAGVLYRGAPATVGNVTTGETTLWTYTLPANVLATNGDSLVIESGGSLANNANSKTLKAYIGAQTLTFFTGTTANVGWYFRHNFIRLSSSSVRSIGTLMMGTATVAIFDASLTTLDFTITNVIKITGTGAATDDMNSKFMSVKFEPAA